MTEEKKRILIRRAKQTFAVLAQVPVEEGPAFIDAANIVYKACRLNACGNDIEAQHLWDKFFFYLFPLTESSLTTFKQMINTKLPEA